MLPFDLISSLAIKVRLKEAVRLRLAGSIGEEDEAVVRCGAVRPDGVCAR